MVRLAVGTAAGMALGALACTPDWQGWFSLAAAGKIAPDFNTQAPKVNILAALPFPPDRFRVLAFQQHGRVSGAQDNSVEVRGVRMAGLNSVARPYWATRVEPLPTEGVAK